MKANQSLHNLGQSDERAESFEKSWNKPMVTIVSKNDAIKPVA